MQFAKQLIFCLTGLILSGLVACSGDEGNAKIEVWLTDSPGDYQEVNIDIRDVRVHSGYEEDGDSGWKSLDFINSGVYNILELTNGLDTLLGTAELPAGNISQVRLILGDNNSVKIGDQVYDLKTPSAQQSGLKLQVHQMLVDGIVYKLLLDFDAARSIVRTGNGKYILKPVIRTITEAQGGAIKGVVVPAASTPAIYAIAGLDTLATAFTDEDGRFLIRGLAPGTYNVAFQPNEDYLPYAIDDVHVSVGVVTDLEVVAISQ